MAVKDEDLKLMTIEEPLGPPMRIKALRPQNLSAPLQTHRKPAERQNVPAFSTTSAGFLWVSNGAAGFLGHIALIYIYVWKTPSISRPKQ